MSYQVLARKWRPRTFSELVGQNEVLQTLTHALDNGRLHHAYLFTGTRGVGKTTIARIIASCVNCEQGVSSTPCGQCNACQEIAAGRFIDLIEVDAASRTKVEDTRELLENVQYAPSRGRYKVYLIDEVHMLSTHSFNALLKTLEEPPPHILFLLATTDPQKLPVTILSRCLQFSLRNMTPELTVRHLQSILLAEEIAAEEPALWHLARAASGSMRDALTLLDQAISHGEGRVTEDSVVSLLGVPDQRSLFTLMSAIRDQQARTVLAGVADLAAHNPDFSRLLENLLGILHRLAIAQVVPEAIDNSEGDEDEIRTLAGSLTGEDIQLYYQIALNARQDFAQAPDQRMAFEMLLLRMLAFTPHGPVNLSETTTATQAVEKKKLTETPEELPAAEPEPQPQPQPQPQSEPDPEAEPEPEPEPEPDPLPAFKPEPAPIPEPTAVQASDVEPVRQAADKDNVSESDRLPITESNWPVIVRNCGLTGIGANLLANCIPERIADTEVHLLLDERQSALFNDRHAAEIQEALAAYADRDLSVSIRVGAADTETPAAASLRIREQRQQQAVEDFMQDRHVRELVEVFSATVARAALTVNLEEEND